MLHFSEIRNLLTNSKKTLQNLLYFMCLYKKIYLLRRYIVHKCSKFWSPLMEHFIQHKPLTSEEWLSLLKKWKSCHRITNKTDLFDLLANARFIPKLCKKKCVVTVKYAGLLTHSTICFPYVKFCNFSIKCRKTQAKSVVFC